MDILKMESPPTHPGEMLLEEFLRPRKISQSDFAKHLGVSFPRLNDLIHGRRSVSIETALLLSRALQTTPDLWLNLQNAWDLWHAVHGDRRTIFKFPEPYWLRFEGPDGDTYEIAPNPNPGIDVWIVRDSKGAVVAEFPVGHQDWPPSAHDIRRAIASVEKARGSGPKEAKVIDLMEALKESLIREHGTSTTATPKKRPSSKRRLG